MVSGFGAEAVVEEVARVGVDDGVAEGVVFEVGDDGAGGGEVFADIAVAVVSGEIVDGGWLIVDGFREEAGYAAGALGGVAEVRAPEAGFCKSQNRWDACAPFIISDAVPSVVEVEGGGGSGFCDAAGLGVVLVAGDDAGDGGAGEAVFCVPGEGAVGGGGGGEGAAGHVTVEIVERVDGRWWIVDGKRRVLVERV